MSALTDKMFASPSNSAIEICILWTLDDAYEDDYGGRLINSQALRHAEEAAAELVALQALQTPMPCGHLARYAVSGEEGTQYCALCELEEMSI